MENTLRKPLTLKHYLLLTKPGIILGNALTTAGGYALAARGQLDLGLFLSMVLGLALIIASACVFNNYIDRNHDAKMNRTKYRALARGIISLRKALLFGTGLGLLGTLTLAVGTNPLTTCVALTGFFFYVIVYSLSKYQTTYGTLIGSIAGAIPPVVGYTAVTHTLDLGAFILFAIIAMWQMPHFFAIAIYRISDYTKASIPVFPRVKGMHKTKIHMIAYLLAFIMATALLTLCGYTTLTFMMIMALVGISWLVLALKGFSAKNDARWARKMFIFSLVVVTTLSVALPFTTVS
jgi:protoheme IX farnesyltransferase